MVEGIPSSSKSQDSNLLTETPTIQNALNDLALRLDNLAATSTDLNPPLPRIKTAAREFQQTLISLEKNLPDSAKIQLINLRKMFEKENGKIDFTLLSKNIADINDGLNQIFNDLNITRTKDQTKIDGWIEEIAASKKPGGPAEISATSDKLAPPYNPKQSDPTRYAPNSDPLRGIDLVYSNHLPTKGTLNLTYSDRTQKQIRYLEFNPKMDDEGYSTDDEWNRERVGVAATLLKNFQNTDMIFLDAEVGPNRLASLMETRVLAKDGNYYKLSDKYEVALDPYKGAILYDKKKYKTSLVANYQYDEDKVPSSRGFKLPTYLSQFAITFTDDPSKMGTAFLGKGPHYDGQSADFLKNALPIVSKNSPQFPRSGLENITTLVGDWNNDVTEERIDAALSDEPEFKKNFVNLYDSLVEPETRHGGSNAEDALAAAKNTDNPAHCPHNIDFTDLKTNKNGKVNGQVLAYKYDGQTISVDNPIILYESQPYGIDPPPIAINTNLPLEPKEITTQEQFVSLSKVTLDSLSNLSDALINNKILQSTFNALSKKVLSTYTAHKIAIALPSNLQEVSTTLTNISNGTTSLTKENISSVLTPLSQTINPLEPDAGLAWDKLANEGIISDSEASPLQLVKQSLQPALVIRDENQFVDIAKVTLDSIAILRDALANNTITPAVFQDTVKQLLEIYANHTKESQIDLSSDLQFVQEGLNNLQLDEKNIETINNTINPLFSVIDPRIPDRRFASERSWSNLMAAKIVTPSEKFPIALVQKVIGISRDPSVPRPSPSFSVSSPAVKASAVSQAERVTTAGRSGPPGIFPFTFTNKSGLSADNITLSVHGDQGGGRTYVTFRPDGSVQYHDRPVPFKLSELPNGTLNLPYLSAGVVEVSATMADGNVLKKNVEFTINPYKNTKNQGTVFFNSTEVDDFSLPISVSETTKSGQTKTVGLEISRQEILDRMQAAYLATPQGSPWQKAWQDFVNDPNGRIKPPQKMLPANYFNTAQAPQKKSWMETFRDKFQSTPILMNDITQTNGKWDTWSGQITSGSNLPIKMVFTNQTRAMPPIEFTLPNNNTDGLLGGNPDAWKLHFGDPKDWDRIGESGEGVGASVIRDLNTAIITNLVPVNGTTKINSYDYFTNNRDKMFKKNLNYTGALDALNYEDLFSRTLLPCAINERLYTFPYADEAQLAAVVNCLPSDFLKGSITLAPLKKPEKNQ